MPGLVNAHTHLELSYLRDEVAPASAFVSWIRGLLAARRQYPDAKAPEILDAIDRAVAEAIAFGTAVVGDISNTLCSFRFARAQSARGCRVLRDRQVQRPRSRGDRRTGAARARRACADRSGQDEPRCACALFSRARWCFARFRRTSTATRSRRAACTWPSRSRKSNSSRPAAGPGARCSRSWVRGIPRGRRRESVPSSTSTRADFSTRVCWPCTACRRRQADLARLASRGTTLVTCPRSNGHTGAGVPPIEEFYRSGVHVAIGTDSLASTPDLSVFAEVATLHALAPSVPAAALLDSATRQGARALGFDADFGTIDPGKLARLLAIALPPQTDDVEEYLVSGIRAGTDSLGDRGVSSQPSSP